MSIFGSIASAIFGSAHAATAGPAAGPAPAPTAPAAAKPAAAAPATASTISAAPPLSQADVEALIARLPGASGGYNWKQSIVDLMKLLNLDSSLGARKQLAQELGYTGALDGSAEMNVWLHKQVMAQLAKSGGQVTAALKHAS